MSSRRLRLRGVSVALFSLICAERGHEKVSPVVHWARAHAQIQLELGNKSHDLVARHLADAHAARKLEQRARIFIAPVGGELSRLRAGWHRELSTHYKGHFHLRDRLSARGEFRSGLNRLSAHAEWRACKKSRLSAHDSVHSFTRDLSAHCERRSDLRYALSYNSSELKRRDRRIRYRLCRCERRDCVQRRCGSRLRHSRGHHSTCDARCALQIL